MKAIDVFNWLMVICSGSYVSYQIIRSYYDIATAKRFQVTRRSTGKSVIINRKMTHDDIRKLNDLFS